ncbi:hypothetical protein Sjap_009136 [Stephania japonica]|uniref:Uncharacterized protein n=1 Tax=Stephania japonica TaxID=461633 RepID=A0AAP0JT93_9MAGN
MDEFPEKIMRICVEDMKKWMDASNKNSPNHLVQLLTRPHSHPLQSHVSMAQQISARAFSQGYRLSCLSFVILERIVSVSMPSALAKSILQTFDEAFEVICYIDEKINVGDSRDQWNRQLAKVLWAYKDVHLSDKDSILSNRRLVSEAISSIKNEQRQLLFVEEMNKITFFILMREREWASIEELYHHLEQLFVEMLHFFLSQVPIAMLKDMNESPVEAHEEKARFVLKLLCKLKLLEDKVQWSFPEGYRFTRLMDPEGEGINDEARNTENQNAAPVDDDQDGQATTIQEGLDFEIVSHG